MEYIEAVRYSACCMSAYAVARVVSPLYAARDRVFTSYRNYYQQRALELAKACDGTLADERQWAHNWTKMVAMLKA